MNKVILCGRLTRDAEIRYSQGEKSTAIARGSLAVDRKYKKEQEQTADFINILSFGKIAEFFEKYGRKGTKFLIEGRIQTGSYTNKDGQRVYTTDVVVEQVEFAESKSSNQSGSSPQSRPAVDDGFMNIDDSINDDELPFT